MSFQDAILVTGIEVIPMKTGVAVFLLTPKKTLLIQIDQQVGEALQAALAQKHSERPLPHDLMLHLLLGLDASVAHVVINEVRNEVFCSRIIVTQEGPLGRKVAEVDARTSDAIVLAVKSKRPVLIASSIIETAEDMSDTLQQLLRKKP
jgi:bifunctional DNase/RNase